MKPTYIFPYLSACGTFEMLLSECPWNNREVPRNECFMAGQALEYEYSKRVYKSVDFHPFVLDTMLLINKEFRTNYNVCFLNYYKDEKQHLGWHADDSDHMNLAHPIAVISVGAAREIWVKPQEYKGVVPKEDRYLLENGSLFIMPTGFQLTHFHKIPKADRPCGGRISMTFRNYI